MESGQNSALQMNIGCTKACGTVVEVLTVAHSQLVPSYILGVPFMPCLAVAFIKYTTPPQKSKIITLARNETHFYHSLHRHRHHHHGPQYFPHWGQDDFADRVQHASLFGKALAILTTLSVVASLAYPYTYLMCGKLDKASELAGGWTQEG